jgi:hypothetical protein
MHDLNRAAQAADRLLQGAQHRAQPSPGGSYDPGTLPQTSSILTALHSSVLFRVYPVRGHNAYNCCSLSPTGRSPDSSHTSGLARAIGRTCGLGARPGWRAGRTSAAGKSRSWLSSPPFFVPVGPFLIVASPLAYAQSQGQWGGPQGGPPPQGQWGGPQGGPPPQGQSQGQWGGPQGGPPPQGQWGGPQGGPPLPSQGGPQGGPPPQGQWGGPQGT